MRTMPTAKERMKQVIEAQPDDASYDELLRELVLYPVISKGLASARAGRTFSNEEMKRRIDLWRR